MDSPTPPSSSTRSSKRPSYPCPTCSKLLDSRNGRRHVRTCHVRADAPENAADAPKEPVQRLGSIGEVLRACNIPEDTLDCWDMAELDKLPNMRLHPLSNDKGRFTPWYVTEERSELPTLGDLMVDIDRKMTFSKRTGVTTAGMAYELWDGTERIVPGFSEAAWTSFCKDIISGRVVTTRIMNMVFPSLSETSMRVGFSAMCSRVGEAMYKEDMERLDPNFNITPHLTKTEVHYDCLPNASTSVGLAQDTEKPLKLWIVWPSTEIQGFESCGADTRKALKVLEHGRFLVQMPGEVVGVPASSPHAVMALNSCYIFGHSFMNRRAGFDPASICVDFRTGSSEKQAVSRRLRQLEIGLKDEKRRLEHAGHFVRTWLSDKDFYNTSFRRQQLLHIWIRDIRDNKQCILCELKGASNKNDKNVRAHVGDHLFNSELPDGDTDEDDQGGQD